MVDNAWLAAYREANPDADEIEFRAGDPAGIERLDVEQE